MEDLQRKVHNGFHYANGTWGGALGTAEFGPVDLGAPVAATPERGKMYRLNYREGWGKALETAGDPLIEGMLDNHTLAVLYGESGSGKTFVMLDMAFHIATGRPWQGREVAQGPVLYIAAEGGRGILKRLAALKTHYGVEDAPLDVVPCPVNMLSNKADIQAVTALARECETEHGAPLKMLVVDTLSRALAGGDENSSVDMGAFIKNVDRVRAAIGCTLSIVHHSGKDTAKGARGWSGLRAATDTEIEIVGSAIRSRKQREEEDAKDIKFKLKKIAIGENAKGRVVSSCVVQLLSGSEFAPIELPPAAVLMWEAFQLAAKGQAENPDNWRAEIVNTDNWEKEYRHLIRENPATNGNCRGGTGERTLRLRRQEVATAGYVEKLNTDQWVSAERQRQ
jgi:KaiC/GvpD/RAD55 family RecA-like ATPase